MALGWKGKLGFAVLSLAPISFITVGAIDTYDAIRFNAVALETEAEVTGIVGGNYAGKSATSKSSGFTSRFPELRYQTATGETITAVSLTGADSELIEPFDTGDILPARYDPATPTDVRLEDATTLLIGNALLLIFGLFTGGLVAIGYLVMRR